MDPITFPRLWKWNISQKETRKPGRASTPILQEILTKEPCPTLFSFSSLLNSDRGFIGSSLTAVGTWWYQMVGLHTYQNSLLENL